MSVDLLDEAASILRLLGRDLAKVIVPELSSPAAIAIASMMSSVLDALAAELKAKDTLLAERNQAVESARSVAAVLRASGPGEVEYLARLLSDSLADLSRGGSFTLLGIVEVAISHLAAHAPMSTAGVHMQGVWRALVTLAEIQTRRVLGGETISWDTSYKESGAGRTTSHEARDRATLSAENLEYYVRTNLPNHEQARVLSLQPLPGGWSKSTFLVTLSANGGQREWVLRCDLPYSVLKSRVSEEFRVLTSLRSLNVPIAEPLWCEPDPAVFGTGVMAVQKVPGSSNVSAWSSDASLARRIGRQAAVVLARLHSLDPGLIGAFDTSVPGSCGATPEEFVDHLRAFWIEKRTEPIPLVELILGWLSRNAPPSFRRRAIVHGDYALNNLLVHNDRIQAVLDWEFCHLGDAQEDLAYLKKFVEQVIPWSDFLDSYQGAGGMSPKDDELRFYSVLSFVRNALGCFGVLHELRTGSLAIDTKLVYVGRRYGLQMLADAAKLTNAF